MASRYGQVVVSDQTNPAFGFTELNSGFFLLAILLVISLIG
jgi:hypothetical protein